MRIRATKRNIIAMFSFIVLAVVLVQATAFIKALSMLAFRSQECACGSGIASILDFNTHNGVIAGVLLLSTIGFIVGLVYLASTILKTRRFIGRAMANCVIKDNSIIVSSSVKCGAFTFGFFRTKIAICDHCVKTLSKRELKAIIMHEKHHATNYDPLKFLIIDTLRYSFFFIPFIGKLASMYRTIAEISADEQVKNQKVLGGVLLRFVDHPANGSVAPFASVLKTRVEKILNPNWQMNISLSMMGVLMSVLFTAGIFGTIFQQESHVVVFETCISKPTVQKCGESDIFNNKSSNYWNQL